MYNKIEMQDSWYFDETSYKKKVSLRKLVAFSGSVKVVKHEKKASLPFSVSLFSFSSNPSLFPLVPGFEKMGDCSRGISILFHPILPLSVSET